MPRTAQRWPRACRGRPAGSARLGEHARLHASPGLGRRGASAPLGRPVAQRARAAAAPRSFPPRSPGHPAAHIDDIRLRRHPTVPHLWPPLQPGPHVGHRIPGGGSQLQACAQSRPRVRRAAALGGCAGGQAGGAPSAPRATGLLRTPRRCRHALGRCAASRAARDPACHLTHHTPLLHRHPLRSWTSASPSGRAALGASTWQVRCS